MFKQDLIKEILKDKTLDKDLVVVANTYQNISNEELIKKLNLLNAFVNKKLFRYFQKRPEKRVNYTINKHTIDRFKVVADKDMRKMSNIVENLIRRYVESRI